jgi:nitroimidazol reductase NimA-like FMN-containing flavoprotein (pyridoxamine 5'-phosphate oxidase superfamily)
VAAEDRTTGIRSTKSGVDRRRGAHLDEEADVSPEDYWPAVSSGGKIVELDRAESLELLTAKKVGRIGFLAEDGPVVLPMNYVVNGDHIIVRTVAFGVVARSAIDQKVAFEVDDVDDFLEAGWSVLVRGAGTLLSDDQLEQLKSSASPDPWAEGPRTLFFSITCDQVSGRRLLPH